MWRRGGAGQIPGVGQGAHRLRGGRAGAHQIRNGDTIDRRHLTKDQKIQVGRQIEPDLAAIAAERQKVLGRTHGTPLSDNCHQGVEESKKGPRTASS